ncbi:hypothetical protein [Mitsuaria sp. GD03876]|uniref:hypothetical protein n=1 Tax=Mitsuaria sp. GD03876 TaxID=2975399 RepID=UPI00244A0C95|nr:hypothetical protein [Mitsuaria sp. GD03876]MDH0865034.1 hypothetical protein [Mitsuaria sp. GD03876]
MKKTFIAAALVAAFGAAQAYDSQGGTTDAGIIKTGGATVSFHGPIGAPGIALDGTNYISLQSIDAFSYKDSATTSGGVAFRRYQLLGYTHAGPGGTISTDLNWFKVPTISQNVYFGLATNPGTPNQHAAFYVGDRTGYALPTATTNYAAAGLLALPATTGSAPVILTGTLQYNTAAGTLNTTGSGLTGGGNTLALATSVNAGAGTFAGTALLNSTVSGTADGKFFGSGATSAVAGTAKGGSGSSAFVAGFGGIKN